MTSISEVVTRFRAALTSCVNGADRLRDAEQNLKDCLDALTMALAGASDDGPIRLLALALDTLSDAHNAVRAAAEGVQREVSRLDSADGTAPSGTTQQPVTPTRPTTLSAERVQQLRDELPPPVVAGTGQKTHGRWVGPVGKAHELVSGKGTFYEDAE